MLAAMTDDRQTAARKRLGIDLQSWRGRLAVGSIAAVAVAALLTLVLALFAGVAWRDATVLGILFAVPVFLTCLRWHMAAVIYLGLLEGAIAALAMIVGVFAAILGAFS
jgi:hypothetical protein